VPAADPRRAAVLDAHAELHRDERAEAGRVEDAGHAEHALAREAGRLHRHVAHRVERVGDDDEDAVGGVAHGLLDDGSDDPCVLRHQVVAAHARLAGEARRDDHDVRAGRIRVVVRAGHARVVADDGGCLGEVEALALRQALHDVDEHDIGESRLGDPLGGRGTDIAGADDGNLVTRHRGWAPFGAHSGGTSHSSPAVTPAVVDAEKATQPAAPQLPLSRQRLPRVGRRCPRGHCRRPLSRDGARAGPSGLG
jgi:hypothetical protein